MFCVVFFQNNKGNLFMADLVSEENRKKEAFGWFSLVFMMFLFPALFFAVVYLPIVMGWAQRW